VGVLAYTIEQNSTIVYGRGQTGVYGESPLGGGVDVYGYGGTQADVYGTSGLGPGVQGENTVTGIFPHGPGVLGHAKADHGVVGYTDSTRGHAGVCGYAAAAGNIAVRGSVNPASATAPFTFAGVFDGNVYVSGILAIGDGKAAAVPHPDGSHRLLYCIESPEAWFEDFGEGTITGGKAEVKLDSGFVAVTDTSTMHVFVMSHDEQHALHIAGKSATGFRVGAVPSTTAAAAGKKVSDLSGTFTYRVVAKRKDIKAERLAKFVLPKAGSVGAPEFPEPSMPSKMSKPSQSPELPPPPTTASKK